MSRKIKRFVHEGKYVAEVEIELIPDDDAWGPYIGAQDALKLDRIKIALRKGDVEAASKEARLFKLLPISA